MTSDFAPMWNASPFRITSYAPSSRQFRLSEDLTPEQITERIGVAPVVRPDGDKVTLQWTFFAEKIYWHNGKTQSVSTCCKIWDYCGARWSAYGFPEAFEQIDLVPQMVSEAGYIEDGNAAIAILTTAEAELDRLRAENERLRHILAAPTKVMLDAGMDAANDALDSDYSSTADGDRDNYSYLRSDAPAKIWAAMVAAFGEQP